MKRWIHSATDVSKYTSKDVYSGQLDSNTLSEIIKEHPDPETRWWAINMKHTSTQDLIYAIANDSSYENRKEAEERALLRNDAPLNFLVEEAYTLLDFIRKHPHSRKIDNLNSLAQNSTLPEDLRSECAEVVKWASDIHLHR